jgi:pimeloyl-ACP methyl ester carboxylesterase
MIPHLQWPQSIKAHLATSTSSTTPSSIATMKRLSSVGVCLLVAAAVPCQSFVVFPALNTPTRATSASSGLHQQQSRRSSNQEYDAYWEDKDDDYFREEEQRYTDDSYFEEGDDYEDDDILEEEEDKLDWEQCDDGSTWVLLPPAYVSKPTAVIHFCGGTFFGSSPKLWYGPLLEGIVRATQCTVVATSIPVTLTENPLQHVTLSRKLQRQFQSAYVDVLEDEYGDITDVPIVALGHSLGSRLLTVLATLAPPNNAAAPPYKNYILMSFTNYGASASIPGVQQLLTSRRNLDVQPPPQPARSGSRKRRSRDQERWDNVWDDDQLYDEELEELIDDLQVTVREQTSKVRDALTPLSEELEFFPTPDQLWDALGPRYSVPQTLIVQFDDDEVDQSAKLALSLTNSTDLKYTRLRGNHLSPVSVEAKDGSWMELPSKATKALWKIVRGKSVKGKSLGESSTMRDLRQSIARYITEVATKED